MQRLGKDISFLIKGSYQKNLEWYILNLLDQIFSDHLLLLSGTFLFFLGRVSFIDFLWKLRLLDIKGRGDLLSQGFAILDGSMVNLLFLMGRFNFFSALSFVSVCLNLKQYFIHHLQNDSDYIIYLY